MELDIFASWLGWLVVYLCLISRETNQKVIKVSGVTTYNDADIMMKKRNLAKRVRYMIPFGNSMTTSAGIQSTVAPEKMGIWKFSDLDLSKVYFKSLCNQVLYMCFRWYLGFNSTCFRGAMEAVGYLLCQFSILKWGHIGHRMSSI